MQAKHLSLIIGIVLLFLFQATTAQVERQFWFVVPQIDPSHDCGSDNSVADIDSNYFRITSGIEGATVRFYYFPNGVQTELCNPVSVGANSSKVVSLKREPLSTEIDFDLLVADAYDSIMDRGIFIESDFPVNIYYQIGCFANMDIFALKGTAALGTEFVPILQTVFGNKNSTSDNCSDWGYDPWATIDIVATENNTAVKISIPTTATPSIFPTYNVKYSNFVDTTILLNRGQIYSIRASSKDKLQSSGIKISSTKAIAISTKDDSALTGNCSKTVSGDVIGDQMIPNSKAGYIYVVPDVSLRFPDAPQFVTVRATQDNTIIKTGTETVSNLNAGDMVQYLGFAKNNTFQIVTANKPIVCAQIIGYPYTDPSKGDGADSVAYELGGAILPPADECTGSAKVSFYRAQDTSFKMVLISHTNTPGTFSYKENAGNWVDFEPVFEDVDINGDLIPDLYFTVDPFQTSGSNYYMVRNSISTFHLGVMHLNTDNGNQQGTFYGYFSGFNTPEIQIATQNQPDGTIKFYATGGVDATYNWRLLNPLPACAQDGDTTDCDCRNDYYLTTCSSNQTTIFDPGSLNFGAYRFECRANHPCSGDTITGYVTIYVTRDNGPGGETRNMSLWLTSEDSVMHAGGYAANGDTVNVWGDISYFRVKNANSDNLEGPIFKNDTRMNINYHPIVDFTDNKLGLDFSDDYIYTNNDGLHIFAVVKPNSVEGASNQFITDFGFNPNSGYGFGYSSEYASHYGPTSYGGAQNVVSHRNDTLASIVSFELSLLGYQNMYLNGSLLDTVPNILHKISTEEISEYFSHIDSAGPFTIGQQSSRLSTEADGGRYFKGSMAELVLYDDVLSSERRMKIESYFAMKYGITLRHDYLASDGTVIWNRDANRDFDQNILVLGLDSLVSYLFQKQSKSVNPHAIVSIGCGNIARTNEENTSNITTDKSFLFCASNNGIPIGQENLTDLPSSVQIRIERVWKVWEINADLGNLEVRFNLSHAGNISASDLRLLIDTDTDFTNATISSTLATDNGDGTYSFIGINLNDGQLFTLSSIDKVNTPLQPRYPELGGIYIGNDPSRYNKSGELHVDSNNKGILLPSLSTDQIMSIQNPAPSLMVYNNSIGKYMFNRGTRTTPQWIVLGGLLKSTTAELKSSEGSYKGEMRYNSSTSTVFYWDSVEWKEMCTTGNTAP